MLFRSLVFPVGSPLASAKYTLVAAMAEASTILPPLETIGLLLLSAVLELVPPFAIGRTPVTIVVSATCANDTVVPSVVRTLFAVVPLAQLGTPVDDVTSADVLAVAKAVTVFAVEA